MIPNIDQILKSDFIRPVLLTVHQQMTVRIFDQGKDSNEQQIGEYSDAYIKVRQRKGLGTNKKVILEFTGQMRNDFRLLEQSDQFGSGFSNQNNADKSRWVEETYSKQIFDLTEAEQKLLEDLLDKKVNDSIN